MDKYRYILEPYKGMKTKHNCPNCEQIKKFTRYIDTETNEYIHFTVGRCDRSANCSYHYTPKQYFSDNEFLLGTPQQPYNFKPKAFITTKEVKPSFIPVELFKASLKSPETNHFVKFLIDLFGIEITNKLISKYFIGTSKYWNSATVFWQIDISGKIRTGKIMLYSPTTGKRIKEPFNHINWVHKVIKQPEFELKQCLFGEHLLHDKTKPVAIVESEKTAVITSVYLPQFIWLAVGSLTNLNAEKCGILKGRTVTLFPDLNGFEKWNNKAKELSHLTIFTVSDLLERKATEAEKKQGFDLADYLTKFDYKKFEQSENLLKPVIENLAKLSIEKLRNVEIQNLTKPYFETITNHNIEKFKAVQSLDEVQKNTENENLTKLDFQNREKMLANVSISESWEQDITELEIYFARIELPTKPLKLNPCSLITNISLFIENHFATVKANNGYRTYLPYLNRLQELKKILTTNLN